MWDKVRQLSSVSDTDLQVDYTYDDSGIRTSKTVNGVTTHYNTKDGVILAQSDGNNTLYFQYDTSGVPFAFVWNDAQYYYVTNQMGDVMGITDANKNLLAQYAYNAWGAPTGVTVTDSQYYDLAEINPLRYRGYYYDSDTELYYLQSRYYDPYLCRFINSDSAEMSGINKEMSVGTNLFVYCENNPVNNIDQSGFSSNPSEGKVANAFLRKYLLKGKTITKFTKIMRDSNKLWSMNVYFKKSKRNTNKLKLTYGYKTPWKKSTTWANNISRKKALLNNYIGQLSGYVSPTQSYSQFKMETAKTVTVDIAVVCIVLGAGVRAATIASKYNKVWGSKGRDPKDKQKYVMFYVSQERSLNGWYLFKYSSSKVIKL